MSHARRAAERLLALVAAAGLALVESACYNPPPYIGCDKVSFGGFEGKAHLETTGDIPSNYELCALSAPDNGTDLGAFVFKWGEEEDTQGLPSLTVLGPFETGTWTISSAPPGPIVTIVLSFAARFVSNDGTCSVTVDSVDANGVAGSLTCTDLSTKDATATIGVHGTFRASRTG